MDKKRKTLILILIILLFIVSCNKKDKLISKVNNKTIFMGEIKFINGNELKKL